MWCSWPHRCVRRYSSRCRRILILYSPERRSIDARARSHHTERMAVKVLGPLDIGAGTLSPRERAILAALIVRQGASMAPAELAEAYWGETVPRTWAQQVRTSVARI